MMERRKGFGGRKWKNIRFIKGFRGGNEWNLWKENGLKS